MPSEAKVAASERGALREGVVGGAEERGPWANWASFYCHEGEFMRKDLLLGGLMLVLLLAWFGAKEVVFEAARRGYPDLGPVLWLGFTGAYLCFLGILGARLLMAWRVSRSRRLLLLGLVLMSLVGLSLRIAFRTEWHVGPEGWQRDPFLAGAREWALRLDYEALRAWGRQHPDFQGEADLPGLPGVVYVGVGQDGDGLIVYLRNHCTLWIGPVPDNQCLQADDLAPGVYLTHSGGR